MGWRSMQEIGVIFLPLPALHHLALLLALLLALSALSTFPTFPALPTLHYPALPLKEQILIEVAQVS